ncbi:MAG: ATPase with chaperone activity, ATP-binding subunit [Deltaproteobacteria bacterium]|jgi:NMD protein affecting ribosome stability and mRNA decay|nr:ATPase with chaperone activity, ATP-binding subunit [Deltaproteobacteria bacterium]
MARGNKLIQDDIHDPYFVRERYRDPSICEKCGVLFRNKAFEWTQKTPSGAAKMICPACRRIEDGFEGGIVVLEGDFLARHKPDILNTIENTEEAEKRKRPLERIISINDQGSRIELRTTYEHIARRIGEAIRKAFKGDLTLQYPTGEKYARVFWRRNGH